jgi:multicomponent Na+:H+ antiporter subunit D
MDSLPPAAIMLVGAVLVMAMPARVRPWVFIATPLLVLVQLLVWLEPDKQFTMSWLALELVPMAVTDLNEVWATVFVLVGVVGGLFALHLRDRVQQAAALAYGGSALGVIFAGDLLTLIVFWEVMAVTSVLLIMNGGRARSHAAGMRYLFVHVVGGSLLLGGILWHVGNTGSLAIGGFEQNAAGWLMFAGVAVNAAMVPVHAWLSDAYPEASVTGMVFLGAFTTKTAVYVLATAFAGWDILLIAGPLMAIYGAMYALMENDIRRLLAYHIISQVGFMVTAAGVGTALALEAVADQAFTHVLWQAVMVMAMGSVLYATGTSKLTELGGLAKPLRSLLGLYMLAAVSISLFPLLAGLGAEDLYTEHAAGLDRRWTTLLLYVASIGTTLAVAVRLPYYVFFGEAQSPVARALPWSMYAALGAGAALSVIVGVVPSTTFEALKLHLDPHAYTSTNVVFGLEVLTFSIVGAWLLLPRLAPRARTLMDIDWLYRKAGRPVRMLIQQPLEWPFSTAHRAVGWITEAAARLAAAPDVRWASPRPSLGASVVAIFGTFAVIVLLSELL